jgi:hypothetical protein
MGTSGAKGDVSLSEYVAQIADELTERVEQQRQVLLSFIAGASSDGKAVDYCPLVHCAPRQKYRAALQDAVRVLEQTRRAFKSRQLEDLRKRLEDLLAAEAGHMH